MDMDTGRSRCLTLIPFIGGVSLFDVDEINFAEISREMIMTEITQYPGQLQTFLRKTTSSFGLGHGMKVFGIMNLPHAYRMHWPVFSSVFY